MRFFWVLSGKRIRRALMAVVAIFFALGIFYAEQENIQVFMPLNSGPAAIYSVDTDKKQLALTFDISWGRNGRARSWMYWNKRG